MRLVTQAGVFALLAGWIGTAVAWGKDRLWAEWQAPPWGTPQPSTERPPSSSVANGRQLAEDCSANAPGARDLYGNDCMAYIGYEGYCGCCDDDDFVASRCPACASPSRAAACAVSVEEKLAMLPNSTEQIQHGGENLVGALPGDIAERFPNLTVLDLRSNRLEGEIPPALWRLPRLRVVHLGGNSLVGALPEAAGLRITYLNLNRNKLTGNIPEAMGSWTELRDLDLSNNQLSGSIPDSVRSWHQLGYLDLSMNKLTGNVPEAVGGWRKVQTVSIHGNELSGPLPTANWTEVRTLYLQSNKLNGSLATDIAERFPNLEALDLGENSLEGEIPPALWRLPHLRGLYLGENSFVGTLPNVEGLRITSLNLNGNRLTGDIPEAMGSWTELRYLDLYNNQLSGSIPDSVGSWRQLVYLNLAKNKLTGHIPDTVGGWSHVQNVGLEENELAGPLPHSMANWTEVRTLFLNGNKLDGSLPDEVLGSWHELRRLRLSENGFSGPIPRSVASLTKIEQFDIGNNFLSGQIPEEVGYWRQVRIVDMARCGLTGTLPEAVGNWSSLWWIDLSNNRLSGPVPESVAAWGRVERVNLHSNSFTGPLPSAVGRWTGLTDLRLQHNEFTGEIPREIIHWSRVNGLSLGNNSFSGEIPPELGNLTALRIVHLYQNRLQGQLPDLSRLLDLTQLLVHNNSLDGLGPLPPNLTVLAANENKLRRLPESVYELHNLEELYINRNLISSWPPRGVIKNKITGSGAISCGKKPEEERFVLPKLKTLVADFNNMTGTSAFAFLSSLAYLPNLKVLSCRGCSLGGVLNRVPTDQAHTGDESCNGMDPAKEGFRALEELVLALNNVTELLAVPPRGLLKADFSSNALEKLDERWFNMDYSNRRLLSFKVFGNPSLHLPVQKPTGLCHKEGAGALVADPSDYQSAYEEGVECTSLCLGRAATRNEVEGLLNASALCRCQPGFGGQGTLCRACAENTYSTPREGDQFHLVRECRACPDQSTTGGENRTTSIAACLCPAGTFLNESASSCQRCPQWPFRTTEVAGERQESACACNSSYVGLKEFAGKCGCDDGTYMNHKTLSCERCSHSEHCSWATDIARSLQPPLLKPGHWAEPVAKPFAKHSIWRCASKESCSEGGICAEGREGHACGLCQAGHHGGPDGPCDPCDESLSLTSRRWSLALGTLALLLPTILLLHMGLTTSDGGVQMSLHLEAMVGSAKQMVKHIQTVSIIGGLSVSWPPVAQAFFEALKQFTVDIPGFLQVGCLSDQTSVVMEMSFKWVMPLAFAAVTALAIPLSRVVSRALQCLARRKPRACRVRGLPRPEKVAMRAEDAARVLLFTFTIFWTTLVANCLQMLTCAPSPNGKYTVETYPQVQCSLKNLEFVALGIVSLLATALYIALPLWFLWCTYLKTTKHLAASERSERGWFRFLFQDFRDGHLAWLVEIMVKDAAFVLVPVVLPGQGAAQLMLIAALCAAHVCAVLQSTPFRDRSNSLLEAWNGATGASLCIYSVGMGYEKTAGMGGIEELFENGIDDSLYRGRADGMVAVQIVAVGVPLLFLLYQLACAWERSKGLLPRCLRPASPEENQMWLQDFLEATERAPFSGVLKRLDIVDMHHFRSFVEQSSATLGHDLSKTSRSLVVRMHSQIRSSRSTSGEHQNEGQESEPLEKQDPVEESDALEDEPVGTLPEEPAPLQGTLRLGSVEI